MSIEGEATVKERPYPNPGNDPRLPVAIWFANGAVIGDASGGHAGVEIVLNAASSQRTGRSWSCETSMPTATSSTVADCRVRTLNLDAAGPGLTNAILKSWIHEMNGISNVENPEAASVTRDIHPGIYLGAQSGGATAARVQAQFNNGDGVTFGWYATGYVWEPAALDLGHLKPSDGLV